MPGRRTGIITGMKGLPKRCVLVRTWFGDDAAWESLVMQAQTPSDEGFLADVTVVDDLSFRDLGAPELIAAQTDGPIVSFLADEATFSSSEFPILAVRVLPRQDYEEGPEHQPFRVIPSELWSVENNINLANLDWSDFTGHAGKDGVFRGF